MKVQLAKPDINEEDINEVVDVLRSGILSIGPKIEEFEKSIAEYVGSKYAIAVNSGTSALNLIIKSLSIGKDDEVITTPFSFVASTNCFLMEGAKPVFVDINPKTFNMDISKIEEKITSKTKAILAVDVFGQPMDMVELRKIVDKYNLYLIEDSCEALGSEYNGIKAGSIGDAGAFAFYPNKQMTTGEGGVIVTNREDIKLMCESLRSQGRAITGFWLHHERLGYNYRMSEINAALGVTQLKRLNTMIEKRLKVANLYNEAFKDVKGITVPYIDSNVSKMSYFVYVVQIDKDIDRDKVMDYLKKNGVGCRPYFTPIHVQPYMKEIFGYDEETYPIAADIGRRSIALPFYNDLTENGICYVVEKLKEAVK